MTPLLLNERVVFKKDDSLLLVDNQEVSLQQKERDLLVYFIENKNTIISKDQLLEAVWGTKHRTDSTIKKTVFNLREKLQDNASSPTFIKTIDRIGYRFIAEISLTTEVLPDCGVVSIDKKAVFNKSKIAAAIIGSLTLVGITSYIQSTLDDARASIIEANKKYLEKMDYTQSPILSAVGSYNGDRVAYSKIVGDNFEQEIIVEDVANGDTLFKIENASYPADRKSVV